LDDVLLQLGRELSSFSVVRPSVSLLTGAEPLLPQRLECFGELRGRLDVARIEETPACCKGLGTSSLTYAIASPRKASRLCVREDAVRAGRDHQGHAVLAGSQDGRAE
jgi:hypothetical protein